MDYSGVDSMIRGRNSGFGSSNNSTKVQTHVDQVIFNNLGRGANALSRTTVDTIEDITFINHIGNSRQFELMKQQQLTSALRFIKLSVLKMYLRQMNVYTAEDSFFEYAAYSEELDRQYDIEMVKSGLTKIMADKEIAGNRMWKICSNNHAMYFICTKDLPVYNTGQDSIVLMVAHFNKPASVCQITHMVLGDDDHIHANDLSLGPFYLARKEHYIKNLINSSRVKDHGAVTPQFIHMVRIAIESFINDYNTDLADFPYPEHSSFERQIFNIIIKKSQYNDWRLINIHSWRNMDSYQEYDFFTALGKLKGFPECFGMDEVKSRYPRVKFSKKEWKFVNDYCEKQNLVYSPDTTIVDTVNMQDILLNPKYGESIIFEYEYGGTIYDITCSYVYDKNTDLCRFYLVYNDIQDYVVSATVDYVKISSLHMANNLNGIDVDITIRDGGILPTGTVEVGEKLPGSFKSARGIITMLWTALEIYMIIHNRPQRSRMVREERKVARSNSTNHKNDKNVSDSEVVVTRILMPIREAKEYVNTMIATSGEHPERNYVLESWPRAGHRRRLPNSDETIWIEPTTCIRHKPLTDKEVVIKL